MWMTLRQFFITAASVAALACSAIAQDFTGDMTAYTLSSPMAGNCNYMTAGAGASVNYAALNAPQFDSTKSCGRCALISCADTRCKDKTKTQLVYLLDQCPECKSGDLDVAPSVFKTLTGSDPARYKIKWKFVNCPVKGSLQYCLKVGSNPYWIAVQPANSAVGIKSMTINGKPTTMVPSAYYYLLQSPTPVNLSSIQISVTSIGGQTVNETVSLTTNKCTPGTKQFTA
jgi:expansin